MEVDASCQFEVAVTVYFGKVNEEKYLSDSDEKFLMSHQSFKVKDVENSYNINKDEAKEIIYQWIEDYQIKMIEEDQKVCYRSIGKKSDSLT